MIRRDRHQVLLAVTILVATGLAAGRPVAVARTQDRPEESAVDESLLTDEAAGFLPPGGLLRPETTLATLMGLSVDRQVEQQELVRDLRALGAWRARRDQRLAQLRDLYGRLDVSFNTGTESDAGDLEGRILDLEATLSSIGAQGRQLRDRIRERRRRMRALDNKVEEIEALLPGDADSLTGVWDVILSPVGESGLFTLYQTGTVLTGEYIIGGGWHGSLEGTIVDGTVFLERIDARKGRFASLSGRVDSSGRTIRGTWKERDLTANRPVEGQWSATRRSRGRGGR
ncbi:MAG: hypothetical protein ACE5IK_05875 [Acidobacteriota bacterium]